MQRINCAVPLLSNLLAGSLQCLRHFSRFQKHPFKDDEYSHSGLLSLVRILETGLTRLRDAVRSHAVELFFRWLSRLASMLRLLVSPNLQSWDRWSETELWAGEAWHVSWGHFRDLPGLSEPMGATLLGKTWRAAESCLMLAEVGNKLGLMLCKFWARRGLRVGKAAGTTDALAALKNSPTGRGKSHFVRSNRIIDRFNAGTTWIPSRLHSCHHFQRL